MTFNAKIRDFFYCVLMVICTMFAPVLSDTVAAQEGDLSLQIQSEKGIALQLPASEHASNVVSFYNFTTIIVLFVLVFVLGLLLYCIIRYNSRSNPVASKFTHNTFIEIIWTVVPVIILVIISFPSFKLLSNEYSPPPSDLTVKVIGNQWYWSYEYPDDDVSFDSVMLEKDQLQKGQPYLLAVDNDLVVPVNKVVKVLITANDVLHSWAMPVFAIKTDAVPGRLNATWFKANRTGTFYGQCSELCGKRHAYMPIAVRIVSQKEYDEWLLKAKQKFASKKQQKHLVQNKNNKKTYSGKTYSGKTYSGKTYSGKTYPLMVAEK